MNVLHNHHGQAAHKAGPNRALKLNNLNRPGPAGLRGLQAGLQAKSYAKFALKSK